MDHIPLLKGSRLRECKVPYVCDNVGEEYDYNGLEFIDFPIRKGWATKEDQYSWLNCPPHELAIRAQSWLYFGLLSQALGESVADVKGHFVSQEEPAEVRWNLSMSQKHINSASLETLIYSRQRHVLASQHHGYLGDLGARNMLLDTTMLYCDCAARHVEPLDEHSAVIGAENGSHDSEASPAHTLMAISLSIKLLIEALIRANQRYCRGRSILREDVPAVPELIPKMRHLETARLVYDFAKCERWCVFQTRRFASHLSTTSMCYLLSLSNPGTAGAQHTLCPQSGDTCVANHGSHKTYVTKHSTDCSATPMSPCKMTGVETDRLVKIIEEGYIPLVEFKTLKNGRLGLKIIRGTPGHRYVVISHVWSGGLGNFQGNQLPLCQIHRLKTSLLEVGGQEFCWNPHQRIRRLQKSGKLGVGPFSYATAFGNACLPQTTPLRFWMDTLCIPVGEQHASSKQRAINDMAKIYVQATSMLVLDESLKLSFPTNSTGELERDAQILCSPWMSRAWTLQEAALGLNRYIQVKGGLISSFSSKDNHMYQETEVINDGEVDETSEPEGYYQDIYAIFRNIQTSTLHPSSKEQNHLSELVRFTKMWNSLSGRTTTMPEDVHVIIATILGFSPREILNIPKEGRMKALLRAHSVLPLALLYESGSRLEPRNENDSWVINYPANGSHMDIRYGTMGRNFKDLEIRQGEVAPLNSSYNGAKVIGYLIKQPQARECWVSLPDTRIRVWITMDNALVDNNMPDSCGCYVILLTRVLRKHTFEQLLSQEYLSKGAIFKVVKKGTTNYSNWICTFKGTIRIRMT